MERIYLDHNATTPAHPDVVQAMLPFFEEIFANPASVVHAPGRQARDHVEEARQRIAEFIGAEAAELTFTSGATESDNLAIKGAAWALRERGDHIVVSAVEHRAVLESCRWLEERGFRVTTLAVDGNARVDPDTVRASLTDRTILVAVMHANSEVGTVQPVREIAEICARAGTLLHCDATQTVGRLPVDVRDLGCDLLAFSGHKFYGPKGIGCLYARRRVRIDPLLSGGGQERGLRSGTVNVPGVIGLARACEIAARDREAEGRRQAGLRDRLYEGILAEIPGVRLNGHPTERLPNNLNVSFESVEAEALVQELRHVAFSSGSACASGMTEPSHVLKAMGLTDALARGSVRFGLGRGNDAAQIEAVVPALAAAVRKIRALA